MESPPNFSMSELAISIEDTASPMTAAAGTAHTSDLSTVAFTGFFVLISTLESGFFNVAMGFMAAFMIISSPVVMPPSMPPELLPFL